MGSRAVCRWLEGPRCPRRTHRDWARRRRGRTRDVPRTGWGHPPGARHLGTVQGDESEYWGISTGSDNRLGNCIIYNASKTELTPPPPPHTHVYTRTHARTHTHAHTHTHTHTRTHPHTHTHPPPHTHIHTCARTPPPIYRHTRTLPPLPPPPPHTHLHERERRGGGQTGRERHIWGKGIQYD